MQIRFAGNGKYGSSDSINYHEKRWFIKQKIAYSWNGASVIARIYWYVYMLKLHW